MFIVNIFELNIFCIIEIIDVCVFFDVFVDELRVENCAFRRRIVALTRVVDVFIVICLILFLC